MPYPLNYVQSGDTLRGIASRLGVTPEQLLATNPWVQQTQLQAGMMLNIPPESFMVAGRPRSAALEAQIGSIPSALDYILGRGGFNLRDAALISRASPFIESLFQGRNIRLQDIFERAGRSALETRMLSPLEFLESTDLLSLARLPEVSGALRGVPSFSTRRLRF